MGAKVVARGVGQYNSNPAPNGTIPLSPPPCPSLNKYLNSTLSPPYAPKPEMSRKTRYE